MINPLTVHYTLNTTTNMSLFTNDEITVLFDNLFDELYSPQEALEELTPEAFSYFLAHGSLDCDAEIN